MRIWNVSVDLGLETVRYFDGGKDLPVVNYLLNIPTFRQVSPEAPKSHIVASSATEN